MLKAMFRGQRGFTLIELLAVIAILSVLAGLVAGAVVGIGESGQAARLSGDKKTLGQGADRFFNDAFPQTYPVVSLTDTDSSIKPTTDLGVRLMNFDATLPQDATKSFVPDFLKEVPDSAALVSWRVDTATGNVFFAKDGTLLARPSAARLDVKATDTTKAVQSDYTFTLQMKKGEAPINVVKMTIPAGYSIGGQTLTAGDKMGTLDIKFASDNPWKSGETITVTQVKVVYVSSNEWKAVVDYDANVSSGGTSNVNVKSSTGTDVRTHLISILPPSGEAPGSLTLTMDRSNESGATITYTDPDAGEAGETFKLIILDKPQNPSTLADISGVNLITNPSTAAVYRWATTQSTAIDVAGFFDGLGGNQAIVIK